MLKQLLERALGLIVRMLAGTWRYEIVGDEGVADLRAKGVPVVFAIWHAQLLPPLWQRRGEGITLLVSNHGDAEYLARVVQRWGYNVVRGSTTRGAVTGTKGIMRVLEAGGDVALTPDGPAGPEHVAKPGTVAVAARAGATIVPAGVGASAWWRARSWDRFCIPKPFARVRVVYGSPMEISAPNGSSLANATRMLGERLDAATDAAAC